MEQQNVVSAVGGQLTPVNNGNVVLKYEMCPSRGMRTVAITDYAYVGQPLGGGNSILGNAPGGVSLAEITNGNGTSNTLYVAHVSMNPQDYDTSDAPWFNSINPTSGQSTP